MRHAHAYAHPEHSNISLSNASQHSTVELEALEQQRANLRRALVAAEQSVLIFSCWFARAAESQGARLPLAKRTGY